jgi:uncharacterized protein (DUF2062 family)
MKQWLRQRLPAPEVLLGNRWIRPFAHRLAEPALWHFNRRSVERGIALGLFAGLIIPLGQTPIAVFLALTVRANVIVAAAATLITNPVTFPAIYYAAYQVGTWLIGSNETRAEPAQDSGWLARALGWLADTSMPTAVGLFLFATVSAVVGFAAVRYGWRLWVRRRWRRRRTPQPR